MAINPDAKQQLIAPGPSDPRIERMTLIILHTSVDAPGVSDLYGFFKSTGIESHFYINMDGLLRQYRDTAFEADANANGDQFIVGGVLCGAISIETEDDSAGKDPNDFKPWSQAQINTLNPLLDWCVSKHPFVKRQKATAWNGVGLGYHSMWGLNQTGKPRINLWTYAVGKTCPTQPRINQFNSIILPRFIAGPSGTPAPVPVPQPPTSGVEVPPATIKKGSKGQLVRNLQGLLEANADDLVSDANSFVDGDFGPNTESVLKTWQKRTGSLVADGICGPATWRYITGWK